MTAHYIAQIVEKKMQELDLCSPDFLQKSMADYNRACGLLGIACGCSFLSHQYRFIEFEQTELVYKHGAEYCEKRNYFENWYRAYGFSYRSKKLAFDAFKKHRY